MWKNLNVTFVIKNYHQGVAGTDTRKFISFVDMFHDIIFLLLLFISMLTALFMDNSINIAGDEWFFVVFGRNIIQKM